MRTLSLKQCLALLDRGATILQEKETHVIILTKDKYMIPYQKSGQYKIAVKVSEENIANKAP